MAENERQEILVAIAPKTKVVDEAVSPRRSGGATKQVVQHLTAVDLGEFQGQVNLFVQQMSQVVNSTPQQRGEFRLAEFEISAGLQVEAGGKINLFLVAEGEMKGALTAGLKFIFKRS